jgi:hypothetical protein
MFASSRELWVMDGCFRHCSSADFFIIEDEQKKKSRKEYLYMKDEITQFEKFREKIPSIN